MPKSTRKRKGRSPSPSTDSEPSEVAHQSVASKTASGQLTRGQKAALTKKRNKELALVQAAEQQTETAEDRGSRERHPRATKKKAMDERIWLGSRAQEPATPAKNGPASSQTARRPKKKKKVLDSDDESDVEQPPAATAAKNVRRRSSIASSDAKSDAIAPREVCPPARQGKFDAPGEISLNSDDSSNAEDGPRVKPSDDDDTNNDDDGAMAIDGDNLPSNFHLEVPTVSPRRQHAPSHAARPRPPSRHPSRGPSRHPSRGPSHHPSRGPSRQPSHGPSRPPSHAPSRQPPRAPSRQPPRVASRSPSRARSRLPSRARSRSPSRSPSRQPSRASSRQSSHAPSRRPSRAASRQLSRAASLHPNGYQPSSGVASNGPRERRRENSHEPPRNHSPEGLPRDRSWEGRHEESPELLYDDSQERDRDREGSDERHRDRDRDREDSDGRHRDVSGKKTGKKSQAKPSKRAAAVLSEEPVITSRKHKTRHRLDIPKDEDSGSYKDDMSWPEHVRLQGDVTGSRFNKTEQSRELQEVIEKTFVHTAKKMALEDPFFDLDDSSHKSMRRIVSDVAAGLDQRSISERMRLDGKNYGNAIASYVKRRVQSRRSEFKQDVEKVVKVHYQLTSRDTRKVKERLDKLRTKDMYLFPIVSVAANGDLTVDTKAPFMHPGILAALELLFVSSRDNCIGFPIISECSSSLSDVEKQEPEIPAPLVAYAASCVCSCLDDFSSGTWSHTSMEASTRMTFRKMLALLQQVKTASAVAYHRLMSKILCEVVPQQKLVIVDSNETAFSVIDLDGLACS
ncbi:hypothetical protein FISHEDRAFT_72927 [Fistulina hepatica ATCC 64428]|uniref:DUF6532 domain-containing protein n=1 Tax=Fistulina hepatica ATCC 64428 TaxID=1128425 RepID=A0A0D7AE16_9AGAR|nr:hypothetical protein FISHEDRAFT_72927 [Fistulina hepatica ATCC 64428]